MALFLDKKIYMVGIKGTGMSTLAIYLKHKRGQVFGWDVREVFSSDEALIAHSIPFTHLSEESIIDPSFDFLIYSSAYTKEHPIIQKALLFNIPIYSYFEFLGYLSRNYPTYGVSGTHGKTTSVACITSLLNSLDVPFSAIYGSSLIDEENQYFPPIDSEEELLFLEACEYRDHFHLLTLKGLFITNIELEHSDYFKSSDQLIASFIHLVELLPIGAPIICNKDEKGIEHILTYVKNRRRDLHLITFSKSDDATFTYTYPYEDDIHSFYIPNMKKTYSTTLVGSSFVSDQVGASLLASVAINNGHVNATQLDALFNQVFLFKGAKGRVHLLSDSSHFFSLYNDYAHHPSEITSSIETIRLLHPTSRLIVIFFPHTVSRMKTFYEDFITSLTLSDTLIIFPVSLSMRHDGCEEEAINVSKSIALRCNGIFVEDVEQAIKTVGALLHSSDVCITMGAGNTHLVITSLLSLKEPLL